MCAIEVEPVTARPVAQQALPSAVRRALTVRSDPPGPLIQEGDEGEMLVVEATTDVPDDDKLMKTRAGLFLRGVVGIQAAPCLVTATGTRLEDC